MLLLVILGYYERGIGLLGDMGILCIWNFVRDFSRLRGGIRVEI